MVNILNFTNPDFLSAKLRLHTSRPVGLSDFPGEELPTCKDQVKQSCYNVKVLGWRITQGANNQATNIFERFWYPWTFTHLRIVCFTHRTLVLLCPWGFRLRSGRGCSMCEIAKQKLCKKALEIMYLNNLMHIFFTSMPIEEYKITFPTVYHFKIKDDLSFWWEWSNKADLAI